MCWGVQLTIADMPDVDAALAQASCMSHHLPNTSSMAFRIERALACLPLDEGCECPSARVPFLRSCPLQVLLPLHELSQRKDAIDAQGLSFEAHSSAVGALRVGRLGCSVEELGLSMVFDQDEPTARGCSSLGRAKHELQPGGEDVEVSLENVKEYVQGVCAAMLCDGVAQQWAAFQEGFNEVARPGVPCTPCVPAPPAPCCFLIAPEPPPPPRSSL